MSEQYGDFFFFFFFSFSYVLLVTVATGVTFSTAGSTPSPAPVAGTARTAHDIPVSGLIAGHGLSSRASADLLDAFPGWTVDVAADHRAKRGSSPVVVIALRSDARRWRPYLLRYATDVLPTRTTVVFQSPGHDGVVDPRRARRTAALLAGGGASSGSPLAGPTTASWTPTRGAA